MILEDLATAGPHGRRQALWQVKDDPDTIGMLRTVRRAGPGRLRRAALDALAYAGGEAVLEPADVDIVERLVRIRRRRDPICSVTSCWTYWWAVRSPDQDSVVAALGLTHLRPTTYALAATVVDILGHDRTETGLVYVGPAINGWVPVVGPWCNAFGDRNASGDPAAEVRATIARLSAQFGEAHAFYFGEQGDGSAWHIARDGVTVRSFDSEAPETLTGDPLPIERAWLAEHGLTGKPEDHPDDLWDVTDANVVAAAVSLNVGWHHPVTGTVSGLPILACAPGTGPVLLPAGVYEI